MRIFTSLLVAAAFTGAVSAQTTDSIQSGPGYGNEVYYSFANGKVKEAPASEWQLAFSIGTFNVSVRTNAAAATGAVTLYEMPGKDTSKWAAFDTAGLSTWAKPVNSDEDWQGGAFNESASGQSDYGWGIYNPDNHIIYGHRLYLATFKSGTETLYKKIWVLNKTLGTWNVRFANIDGSDAKEVAIASSAYPTKNFAYVSLTTGTVLDREPAKTDWDLVLTRYVGNLPGMGLYPVYGILTNPAVRTAEVRGKEETTSTLADTTSSSDNISVIGSDWKDMMLTSAIDSLSYFVQVANGDIYKLVFTGVESGSTASGKNGKVVFNKTKVYTAPVSGLNDAGTINTFAVYPNPVSDVVNVLFDVTEANSTVSISDLSGRTLLTENISGKGFQTKAISLGSFAKGIYLISITNGSSRSVQKVIVQ